MFTDSGSCLISQRTVSATIIAIEYAHKQLLRAALESSREMILSTRLISIAATICLAHGLSACQPEAEEVSTAQKAIDELQKQYNELVDDKMDAPIDWATEDIENIGDWEYRVENLAFSTPDELASQLNGLGNDRWEVIWLERTPAGYFAVLKKPSISYLSKIPLSQLGRIMIGGPEGSE